jgi:uncharacterized HAD superfamily protein
MLKENLNSLKNLLEDYCPSLGIDVDGCIDESPIFFSILTNNWTGKVFVISLRSNVEELEIFLNKQKIKYDNIFLVKKLEEKAKVIIENGISFFIDDQPEVLRHIPDTVSVMLFRNGGNFHYGEKKWMMSDQTGMVM